MIRRINTLKNVGRFIRPCCWYATFGKRGR